MILGIGTDHVEVESFTSLMKRKRGAFVRRVFTEAEIKSARTSNSQRQSLAGRFAAKEATMKAFGTGWTDTFDWKDVEVRNRKSGQPQVTLKGQAATLATKLRVKRILVSISHTKHLASAVVVLEG